MEPKFKVGQKVRVVEVKDPVHRAKWEYLTFNKYRNDTGVIREVINATVEQVPYTKDWGVTNVVLYRVQYDRDKQWRHTPEEALELVG